MVLRGHAHREIALTAGITAGLYMLFLGLEDPDGPTVPGLRGG
ncbi:hypothetical protein SAMN06296028_109111 [Kocuria indica]|uniref:Uncharacterized protein n=1 Tax=Kocuria marina subsp. indica TaxID=1049583 RepID=A0A1X7D8Z7_9MICC|nr:hypothetical protein SAMN06296028_109111 [Kocuria indica]